MIEIIYTFIDSRPVRLNDICRLFFYILLDDSKSPIINADEN